ncbi:S8 family peptidase [Amycolatopsis cihanbeyliensis]|nr:S8 family peptidase [Amycolatopsis cihanbeyliensis]
MTQLSFDAGTEHAHLRLAQVLGPLPRRRTPGGGGGQGPSYPDHRSHARNIDRQLESIRDRHREREPVLGIKPELVMVIEFNRKVHDLTDEVERAGAHVLGVTGHQALAAFASDPALTAFRERCQAFHSETTAEGTPRYRSLFDAIDVVRPLEPADVIDDDVRERVAGADPAELLRVDLECWCTETRADTERRHQETRTALAHAGAGELDTSCRHDVGFSLIRADIPAGRLVEVVRTDRVSRVSLLPRPLLTRSQVRLWSHDRFPPVEPPNQRSATLAVIDSGIQAGHPLLAPAVREALAIAPFTDGADENGHGSRVASLALYGSLERALHYRQPLRPAGKLLGIRVLDHQTEFPDKTLWQPMVEEAVELAIGHGARVINLSLGDPAHPYRPPRPVAIAAALDQLARQHDVVLVVSTGNVFPGDHTGVEYAARQVTSGEHRLAPPSMAALALTVGALVPGHEQGARPARESVSVRPLGPQGTPSPVSRTGPGIEDAIKPELTAPGGTYVHDRDRKQVRTDRATGTIVGGTGGDPEHLLDTDIGTSLAAPLVSHACLRVLGRYPWLSGRAVRALVLASAEPVPQVLDADTDKAADRAQLGLSGFGRVSTERAEVSTEHRAVLLAEESMRPDQVHFYEVPVPSAFFATGRKSLTVALAFNPDTRATSLKYLASRMSVYAYRGPSVQEVQRKFTASGGEPPEALDNAKVDLQPSDKRRLLGANQAATKRWTTHRWKHPEHERLVLVVRNTSRWAAPDDPQRYALAVVLEVDESMPGLYAELRARFEALVEIETEIEI